MPPPWTLRADWVLPIDAPPIESGEVVVEGDTILEVRPSGAGSADRDLGRCILMPGFVNAHTHLEYTALRGLIEDVPFFPWIRALTATKAGLSSDDWLGSAMLGGMECLAAGITTIADNTDAGVTATAAQLCGLRAIIYQEVFGIDHREPIEQIIESLKAKLRSLRTLESNRIRVGISPHAPYTVRPELFTELVTYARADRLGLSIHVAESPAESQLTQLGDGPFARMLDARGIEWQVPHCSPTRYVSDLNALAPDTLAIHCVHQNDADIALVCESGAAIVHCPKSNAKLGAGVAPLIQWLETDGLRLALGTDSAASNNTLDMFEEMRAAVFLQRAHHERVEGVSARQMVDVATAGGAAAMGLSTQVGTLTPGKRADLIAVRVDLPHSVPCTDPYAALVYSARADDVSFTMVDGEILYDGGDWTTIDAGAILHTALSIRSRVSIPNLKPT